MIRLENLHKAFGKHVILNGLNLEIPDGKITVIIGRSGAGKSVLLKHMIGLLAPDSGRVIVDDQDLSALGEMELNGFRKRFGMLFQQAALFDSMNVYENVSFPLIEHTDWNEAAIRKRVTEVLKLVGLPNVEEKLPSELSGGMRKRVGLARALALTPKIILYDEPTTGLDPIMTDSISQLIHHTQQQLGVTSIIISHDLGASFRIADKVVMLHEGKILLEGTEKDFRSSKLPFVQHFLEGRALEGED